MRFPEKTTRLYQQLKDDIQSGRLAPGKQLPPELEFAKQLQVGRITLRSALERLEAEALVNRIERKGTFVRVQKQQSPIILLLPCEDYAAKVGYGSMISLQMLLNGAIQAGQARGIRVETLAMSKSNQPDDINWDAFSSFDRQSRVIVLGWWFQNLFDFLLERGCQVAHVASRGGYTPEMWAKTCHWHHVYFALEDIWETAARSLVERGCRKLAFATNQPEVANCAIRLGYQRVVTHEPIAVDLLHITSSEVFCRKIQQFWQQRQFDGLLLNFTNFGHPPLERFGLPESVRMVIELAIGVEAPDFAEWFCCPMQQAGKAAAELLLDDASPQSRLIPLSLQPPVASTQFKDIVMI